MSIQSISPRELAAWLTAGEATLIDVREPDEFRSEHIAAALSAPLADLRGSIPQMSLGANRRIVFQCQKGGRGAQACALAEQALDGRAVYNLDGGIAAWKVAGLPIISGVASGVSIFRQVQIGVGFLVAASVAAGFSGYMAGFAFAGFFGTMLMIAGVTGWCGMALVLARMPWNRA